MLLRVGLVVNPFAGIGGPVGLKGSDGDATRAEALRRGSELRAVARTRRALQLFAKGGGRARFYCWGGAMGEDALRDLGLDVHVARQAKVDASSAADTREAASALVDSGVDILLFAGGDGTARDVLDAVGQRVPVLGIPSGVKMHSGVYAVSPEAAGELLLRLSRAGLVNIAPREVRDIDEEAFRAGRVQARFYGELLAPEEGHFLQHTKIAGVESEELVAEDIAADIAEGVDPRVLYLLGPGSTLAAVKHALGVEPTLLGVDAVRDGELLAADATEAELLKLLDAHSGPARILVTAIGGQGHVFGRGNQQLSPAVIRRVGLDNVDILAGKGKIRGLEGRPLLVDTNDPELDNALCGYRRVITGYNDAILYPVASSP